MERRTEVLSSIKVASMNVESKAEDNIFSTLHSLMFYWRLDILFTQRDIKVRLIFHICWKYAINVSFSFVQQWLIHAWDYSCTMLLNNMPHLV